MNSRTALWATLLLALPAHAAPLDRAVILSGGGSTFSNHYSQYLQTRLLTDHMRTRTSPDQVDVFFGAGNSETSGDPFPDVHRLIHSKEEGEVDEFLPGTIPGNRMADKDTFLGFVRKELKKKAKEDGNLFLFVTDHGMPNQNKNGEWDHRYSNNCINLWEQDPETLLTASFKDSCLSVNELKKSLKRTPKKKLVFVMTQCFSGGFHGLSVQSDSHGYVSADRNVCGFSSTTEDTTASGCTPDVDDSSYQGYERHFAEALSGIDVVTGEKTGAPAKSVRDAHYEAARIDRTKDIPLSTASSI